MSSGLLLRNTTTRDTCQGEPGVCSFLPREQVPPMFSLSARVTVVASCHELSLPFIATSFHEQMFGHFPRTLPCADCFVHMHASALFICTFLLCSYARFCLLWVSSTFAHLTQCRQRLRIIQYRYTRNRGSKQPDHFNCRGHDGAGLFKVSSRGTQTSSRWQVYETFNKPTRRGLTERIA